MRVLHILDHSIPLQTGYAFRTLAMLKEQREQGWETLHLTGPKQGSGVLTDEHIDGWHFYRTPPPGGLLEGIAGLVEIEMMGDITHRIEQVVKRMRPHILHAHSPVLNAIPALRVGRRLGTPVVYEARALWEDAAVDRGTGREGNWRYRLARALETWVFKRADAVTAVCDGLREDIVARGIHAEKVTVIPNAVDMEDFPEGLVHDPELKRMLGLADSRILGFVGTFGAHEGLAVLIRALPQVLARHGDVRVLLIGDGPQEAQLRQLAADLGVADKVAFAGRVAHADLPRYRGLIDVMVYPRLSTRHTELVAPLKLLEAMAQGCLVAASDVGGARELVRHGKSGVLFKPGDPGALAMAVTGLLDAQVRWPALKAAARRFVEAERSQAAVMARYEEVYARVMRRPGK